MNAYRILVAEYRKSVEALKTASALASDHYSKVPEGFDNWTEEAQDEFFVAAGAHDTDIDSRFGVRSAINAMHAARQAMFLGGLSAIRTLPQFAPHREMIEQVVGGFEVMSVKRQNQLLAIFLAFDGKPYQGRATFTAPAQDNERQIAEFQMQASGRLFL